jgi:hypothetical protein
LRQGASGAVLPSSRTPSSPALHFFKCHDCDYFFNAD